MLKLFNEEAMKVTLIMFPEYKEIHHEINVRITNLTIPTLLRKLRQKDLNTLVLVGGIVTRRTAVFHNYN